MSDQNLSIGQLTVIGVGGSAIFSVVWSQIEKGLDTYALAKLKNNSDCQEFISHGVFQRREYAKVGIKNLKTNQTSALWQLKATHFSAWRVVFVMAFLTSLFVGLASLKSILEDRIEQNFGKQPKG